MEKYLSQREMEKYPPGKKYKKISYGGNKVFIKMRLSQGRKGFCLAEFFLKNGRWKMDKIERKRIFKKGIQSSLIRQALDELNRSGVKNPVNLKLSVKEYKKLYTSYPDADELGYYRKNSPEYVRVKDILNVVEKNSIVYDAGCNSGGIGKILIQKKRCQVFGSELAPLLAQKAKKKGVKVFCGWAEKTPYRSSFFDYSLITFILEHVLNPDKIIKETVRVTKKSGKIIGHVPTEFGDWGKKTIGTHSEHLRAYDSQELKDILTKHGLKEINIYKEKLVGRRIADYYFFTAKK